MATKGEGFRCKLSLPLVLAGVITSLLLSPIIGDVYLAALSMGIIVNSGRTPHWLSVSGNASYNLIIVGRGTEPEITMDMDDSMRVPPGGGFLAHRVSWELHFGPIPAGLFVCHHCDNPPCVRPDHLFLGTQSDNMKDRMVKGRAAVKLSADIIRQIRDDFSKGMSKTAIARKFSVDLNNIILILRGKIWSWVI